MPVKFPRPTSNKSGTKIASILHQIHGSLTTRRDPTAKDNWGLSGVLGSLTPRGHSPYPHSLHEGRMNHTPCCLNTFPISWIIACINASEPRSGIPRLINELM